MKERKYVPPFTGPLSDFPKDPEVPEGVDVVKFSDRVDRDPVLHINVVYDRKNDVDLHLQIIVPEHMAEPERTYPLIVFVPGSAWMKQAVFHSLLNMTRMAKKGYVVAVVEYRHSGLIGFPAQAEDAKTAIRFMRLHAKEYSVDPESVTVWGDSSGGHTALIAGFTGDAYPDNKTYGDISCKVNCIVDWYGPTDIAEMNAFPSAQEHISPASPEGRLIGFRNVQENEEAAAKASPVNYVSKETYVPPLLIMHGNRDQLVCYQQSVELYKKMKALGKDVRMVCLDGAYHGFGGFQSDEALDMVDRFIREKSGQKSIIQDGIYIGVDGCKGGWAAVVLDHGDMKLRRYNTISDIIDEYPEFDALMIDMAIGLRNNAAQIRPDDLARKELGDKGSSVFPIPSRSAVYAEGENAQKEENIKCLGKSLAKQSLAIIPKIKELDMFLDEHPEYRNRILESHPEVVFARLNGAVIWSRKKEYLGFLERVSVLTGYLEKEALKGLWEKAKEYECAPDDLMDAACHAVAGALNAHGMCETIPSEPEKDEKGLYMMLTVPRK